MSEFSDHQVKTVNLDSLTLYEKNANIHPDAQIDQLANSITEWGWTIPILIDENSQIIAGHGRYYAAKKLGMNSAPCITITGWSEEQKRAYVLADNKLAENSKWDDELLKAELSEILSEGYDLKLLGFEQFDFDRLQDGESMDSFYFEESNEELDEADNDIAPKKKTDEGFAEFALVMSVENKKQLLDKINYVKKEHEITSTEEAMMIIVSAYV